MLKTRYIKFPLIHSPVVKSETGQHGDLIHDDQGVLLHQGHHIGVDPLDYHHFVLLIFQEPGHDLEAVPKLDCSLLSELEEVVPSLDGVGHSKVMSECVLKTKDHNLVGGVLPDPV